MKVFPGPSLHNSEECPQVNERMTPSNVTSHAVKAPIAMLGLSNGARLTGFVAGLSRATAEHNVTVNNLLPGTFDTDRLKSNLQALATNTKRSVEEVTADKRHIADDIP